MQNLNRIFLVTALFFSLPFAALAGGQTLTVVELFTSQGCSSCPPADSYVGELAKRDDLLALSYHVDYWDYIGWKDPFAKAEYTQRQRRYSQLMNLSYVYTPQTVIQGSEQAVGSEISKINSKISKTQQTQPLPVSIKKKPGGDFEVSIEAIKSPEPVEIYLVGFDRSHSTDIRRGENSGRKLYNYNVVRDMRWVGTWSGKAITLPAKMLATTSHKPIDFAVIVQSKKTGKIFGAAKFSQYNSGS